MIGRILFLILSLIALAIILFIIYDHYFGAF